MNLVFCVFYAMSCGLVVWLVVYSINISGCFVLFGTVISILMKRKEEEGDVRYHSYITSEQKDWVSGSRKWPGLLTSRWVGQKKSKIMLTDVI